MSSVFLCSPTNSTMFTTCCQVAICDDQQKCPRCKELVFPFYQGMSEADRTHYAGGYYNHNTRAARWSRAYKARS